MLKDNIAVPFRILEYIKSVKYFRHDNGYITHQQLLDDPPLTVIKELITQKVKKYFYDYCQYSEEAKPVLTSSWANLHKKGDYGQMHYHQNSLNLYLGNL